MKTDFRQALARLVPLIMPDLLFRLGRDGQPLFKELAAAIAPTEFMPGKVFGTGTLSPIDYCVQLAEGRIAAPSNLDIATIQEQELAMAFRFHVPQYLGRRAADWRARGYTETLVDFRALNARSKFWGDDQRAAFLNWEEVSDPRNPHGGRQGVNERIMLRELLRRVDMMVMLENRLDALVRLHTPFPPGKIGGAYQPGLPHNLSPRDVLRAERGTHGGPGAGRFRHDRLRSGVRAQRRPHALRDEAVRHADGDSAAGVAVLAGVPRRAGPRGRRADDRLGVRGRLEAAYSPAGVRPAAGVIGARGSSSANVDHPTAQSSARG